MITKMLQQMPRICLVTADQFCRGLFNLALIPIHSQNAQQETGKAGHKQQMCIILIAIVVYFTVGVL